MLEERLGDIFIDAPELAKLLEQAIDLDQGNLKIKNSIKINPNFKQLKLVPEVGQLETELEGGLEELLEKRIEALEERFEILLDNDFQLGLLEQISNLDQESLKN